MITNGADFGCPVEAELTKREFASQILAGLDSLENSKNIELLPGQAIDLANKIIKKIIKLN